MPGHNVPRKTYPQPPDELSAIALGEWHRCIRMFYQNDFICDLDRGLLVAYCAAYGRWAEAERELNVTKDMDGLLSHGARGGVFVNPLVEVANTALRDMVRFADHLGMTPMSRAKLLAALAEPEGPIGKKEEQFREAQRVASGRFATAAPPRLIASNE